MFSLIRRRPAPTEKRVARANASPFLTLRDEMDSFMNNFMGGWDLPAEWAEPRDWRVEETDKEVIMRLDLPGFEASEIDLRLEGEIVAIQANHVDAKEGNEEARA